MHEAIVTENLEKVYRVRQRKGLFGSRERTITALESLDLEVKPGEVFGLLGPNGAGKTTLIKCLTTLLVPSAGTVRVNGFLLGREDDRIRASIGCMLMGDRGLYWKLTGRENLDFFGALYHLSPRDRRRRAAELAERLGLGEFLDRPVATYSSGQRMKLAFAKALINDAPLIVLDEPTNTLDVPSAKALRDEVEALQREGRTVLYTTHIMSEAEQLCDRVAIIDRGRILALGTVPELKASLRREEVIRIDGVIPARAGEAVGQLPGVERTALASRNGHNELTVVTRERAMLPVLIDTLHRHDCLLTSIAPQQATLEDVFLACTGRTLNQDTTQR